MGEGNCINADVRVRKIKMLFFQQKNHCGCVAALGKGCKTKTEKRGHFVTLLMIKLKDCKNDNI